MWIRKRPWNYENSTVFWSECRDSNSRPLEPHSSAIPNFATPGFCSVSRQLRYNNTSFSKKQALFSVFFEKSYFCNNCTNHSPSHPLSSIQFAQNHFAEASAVYGYCAGQLLYYCKSSVPFYRTELFIIHRVDC